MKMHLQKPLQICPFWKVMHNDSFRECIGWSFRSNISLLHLQHAFHRLENCFGTPVTTSAQAYFVCFTHCSKDTKEASFRIALRSLRFFLCGPSEKYLRNIEHVLAE